MNQKQNEMPPEKNICTQCGAVLPSGDLEGLCPACLLKQGTAEIADPSQQSFEPPSLEEMARLFPQLEILSLIGKGGMGAVYKARQTALDRLVALKILPAQPGSGPEFSERFNRELLRDEIRQTLAHPGQADEEIRALFSAFSG